MQAAFVAEYLVDRNGTQAAIRAGYSVKAAATQASILLTYPKVLAAVTAGEAAIAKRNELSQDMIVAELRKLGFSNMLDYIQVHENGMASVDLKTLTRDQAAAITELTVEEFVEGTGPAAERIRRVKIKLADKRAPLVDLGKHIGMFKDTPAVAVAIGINITADDAGL